MVKDHSDSESGNLLPPHGLLFPISSKGSFICTIHRQDSLYISLCYTNRGALAETKIDREIDRETDRQTDIQIDRQIDADFLRNISLYPQDCSHSALLLCVQFSLQEIHVL